MSEKRWFRAAWIGWLLALILGVGIGYGLKEPMIAYFTVWACILPAGVWALFFWGKGVKR